MIHWLAVLVKECLVVLAGIIGYIAFVVAIGRWLRRCRRRQFPEDRT